MATEAQIAANRANAQRSTGPRTAQGKAVVARNALKHGLNASDDTLLPNESPEEYQQLADGLLQALQPRDPFELLLVQRIIQSAWRLMRAEKFETHILAGYCRWKAETAPARFYYGLTALMEHNYDQHLHRLHTATERSLYRAYKALAKYRNTTRKSAKTNPNSSTATPTQPTPNI